MEVLIVVDQPELQRRSYDRRKITNIQELLLADLCADAGVCFIGIQKMYGTKPDHVVFLDNAGSSRCLPIPGLTIEAVMNKAAESTGRFLASREEAKC